MPSAGAQVDAALRSHSGPVDCVRRMLKEEGLRSFHKGLSAGYWALLTKISTVCSIHQSAAATCVIV